MRALDTQGNEIGLRLLVKVREIDRSSRWRDDARTGLRFTAKFRTDNGSRITFKGSPNSFGWSTTGVEDCFSNESEVLPDLDYRRYPDVIRLDMPGECFAGAETVDVSVGTKLLSNRGRLVDRAAATEAVAFGDEPGES